MCCDIFPLLVFVKWFLLKLCQRCNALTWIGLNELKDNLIHWKTDCAGSTTNTTVVVMAATAALWQSAELVY